MACCLMAPSHYLNQCWLIINGVLWYSPYNNFTGSTWDISSWYEFEIYNFEIMATCPRGQWVKCMEPRSYLEPKKGIPYLTDMLYSSTWYMHVQNEWYIWQSVNTNSMMTPLEPWNFRPRLLLNSIYSLMVNFQSPQTYVPSNGGISDTFWVCMFTVSHM